MKRNKYIPVDASGEERMVAEVLAELPDSTKSEEEKEDELFTAVLRELSETDRLKIFIHCAKRGCITYHK